MMRKPENFKKLVDYEECSCVRCVLYRAIDLSIVFSSVFDIGATPFVWHRKIGMTIQHRKNQIRTYYLVVGCWFSSAPLAPTHAKHSDCAAA